MKTRGGGRVGGTRWPGRTPVGRDRLADALDRIEPLRSA